MADRIPQSVQRFVDALSNLRPDGGFDTLALSVIDLDRGDENFYYRLYQLLYSYLTVEMLAPNDELITAWSKLFINLGISIQDLQQIMNMIPRENLDTRDHVFGLNIEEIMYMYSH